MTHSDNHRRVGILAYDGEILVNMRPVDYRNVFEALPDAVALIEHTPDGSFQFSAVNAAWERLFGRPRTDYEALLIGLIFPRYLATDLAVACERCIESNAAVELEILVPGALHEGPQKWHLSPMRVETGVGCVALTAWPVHSEAEWQSTLHLRNIIEQASDFIAHQDSAGRYLFFNSALQQIFGVRESDVLGKTPTQAWPDSPSAAVGEAALSEVVRTGQPRIVEFLMEPPGRRIWHQVHYAPERNAQGEIVSVLSIGRDITPLKLAEEKLRESERELRVLNTDLEERVAARTMDLQIANRDLQNFAHTVSHDLRAPLRSIIGFSSLLKEEEADNLSEQGRATLDRIRNAASKLNRLISEILQYSHAGQAALTRRLVSLTELAKEVAAELLVQYPRANVTVGDLPQVSGDATMLEQVLQNLLSNAFKFSAHQDHPRVEVNWQSQNGEVVFWVRDNGAGFDMRQAGKLGVLFKRFHNEREFPGSGVGLAIVQRLVERHGGRFWAQSEPGAGATFFFTIPAA